MLKKYLAFSAERSSAGLLEFDDVKDAVDVLMNCNHHPIDNPGKTLFSQIFIVRIFQKSNASRPFLLLSIFLYSFNGP